MTTDLIDQKIVLFIFGGREANMKIQWPYLERLMKEFPRLEVHIWDLTRTPGDQRYLRGLTSPERPRVRLLGAFHPGHPIRCLYPNGARRHRGYPPCECLLHKPPYEKPYGYYARREDLADAIFVKMDDDVMFLETVRFADLIAPLQEHPNRVISANVVNNAVCSKYAYSPLPQITANRFVVGDPDFASNDTRWWGLHMSGEYAEWVHDWFLSTFNSGANPWPQGYVRTRPGEAVSINCIAFTHPTMQRMDAMFKHDARMGDEGAVDRMLPWICLSFRAAHLTFGPQEHALGRDKIKQLRQRYEQLSEEYLS